MFKNIRQYINKKLGSGHYGTAYLLNNGTVLKVTRDKSEALFFNSIKNKRLANVCKIYGVYKVGSLYYIFKEYLTPIDNEFQETYINFFKRLMLSNYKNESLDKNDIHMITHLIWEMQEEFSYYITEDKVKENIKNIRKFVRDLIGMFSDSHKIIGNVQYNIDLRSVNVGYDSKGTLKLFDINLRNARDLKLDNIFIDGDESNMPLMEESTINKKLNEEKTKKEFTKQDFYNIIDECINNPSLLERIPNEYDILDNRYYYLLCESVLENNWSNIKYVDINLSEYNSVYDHLCKNSISYNINNVMYVKINGDRLYNILKEYIIINYDNIKTLSILTNDKTKFNVYFNLCKLAVSINPHAINFINLDKRYMNILNNIIKGDIKINNKYNNNKTDISIFEKYIDKKLGHGAFGEAYLLKNGKVLKITTDLTEVKFFNMAMKRNLPHICHVYGVYRSNIDNEKYYIFKECLETLKNNSLEKQINPIFKNVIYNNRNKAKEILKKDNKIIYNNIMGFLHYSFEKLSNEIFNIVQQLKGLYSNCIDILGLKEYDDLDINDNNIGYDNNKILKVFDMSTYGFEVINNKGFNKKIGIKQPSEKLMPLTESEESDLSDNSFINNIIKSGKNEITSEIYDELLNKCKENPSLLAEIPNKYNIYKNFRYNKICNELIIINPINLQYIPINVSTEEEDYINLCRIAIRYNIEVIKYIKLKGDNLFRVLKVCINTNPINIEYLKNFNNIDFTTYFNLCKYAVTMDSNAINYIKLDSKYMDILNNIINGVINTKDKTKYNIRDYDIFKDYIVNSLGIGSYGEAFLLTNGRVLKITTDLSEVRFFNMAMKRNFPHICKVYGVFKSKIRNNAYYIFKEKLNPLRYDNFNYDGYKNIIVKVRTYLQYNGEEFKEVLSKGDTSIYEYIMDSSIDSFKKDMYDNILNYKDSKYNTKSSSFFNRDLFDFIEDLKGVYINCINILGLTKYNDLDINSGNIGYDRNGILKVFDMSTVRWEDTNDIKIKGINKSSEKLMPLTESDFIS